MYFSSPSKVKQFQYEITYYTNAKNGRLSKRYQAPYTYQSVVKTRIESDVLTFNPEVLAKAIPNDLWKKSPSSVIRVFVTYRDVDDSAYWGLKTRMIHSVKKEDQKVIEDNKTCPYLKKVLTRQMFSEDV